MSKLPKPHIVYQWEDEPKQTPDIGGYAVVFGLGFSIGTLVGMITIAIIAETAGLW